MKRTRKEPWGEKFLDQTLDSNLCEDNNYTKTCFDAVKICSSSTKNLGAKFGRPKFGSDMLHVIWNEQFTNTKQQGGKLEIAQEGGDKEEDSLWKEAPQAHATRMSLIVLCRCCCWWCKWMWSPWCWDTYSLCHTIWTWKEVYYWMWLPNGHQRRW